MSSVLNTHVLSNHVTIAVDIDPNPVVPFTNTTAYGKGSLDKRVCPLK